MMNKRLCFFTLTLVLLQSPWTLAGEASDGIKEGLQDRREGVKTVVTSPAHIVEETAEGTEGGPPITGTAVGAVKGSAQTGGQIVEGAGEYVKGTGKVLTAPIKAVAE